MSVDLEAMRSKLQLDAKDFASGLDAASGKLSGFRRLMASASATAAGFLGASVIQRGIEGIKNQIGGFISASSDLNETVSKTQVVFGDSFDAIDKWAKNSAAAFGLSRQQAFDTVSTYGAMAKAAGLSGDAAVSFGTDLVGAAADLGSFWNFDPSQVAEDIRSGLAGEAEPLRKYNIFLNETAVNAKAAELGLGGANGELTDQEKVLARQAIIMEQLGPAAGDYARTQKGLANGTRTLTAYFKNFQAWLGGKIVPTVAKGVAWINKLAGRFQRLREDGLSPTQAILKTLRIELYQVFGRGVLDAITSVARAFVAVWGAVKLWGGSLIDAFRSGSKVSDLVERFPKPLQGMAKGFLTIADAVGDAFAAFRSGGFSGLLDQLGPSIKQAVSGVGDLVKEFAGFAVDLGAWTLKVGIPKLGGWIASIGGSLWDWVKGQLGIGTSVTGDGTGGPDTDRHVSIGNWLLDVTAPKLSGWIVEVAGDLWGWIKKAANWTTNAFSETVTTSIATGILLFGWLVDHRDAIWSGIKSAVGWATEKFTEAVTAAVTAGILLFGWFMDHKDNIWSGIKSLAGWSSEKFEDAITVVVDAAISLGEIDYATPAAAIGSGLVSAVSGITSLGSDVASAVWGQITSFEWASLITVDSFTAGSDFGTAIHDAIVGVTKAAINLITDLSADDVTRIFKAVAAGMVAAAAAVPVAIALAATAIASFIAGAIKGLVFGDDTDFGSIITKISEGIEANVTADSMTNAAKAIAGALWDALKTIITGWSWSDIAGWIGGGGSDNSAPDPSNISGPADVFFANPADKARFDASSGVARGQMTPASVPSVPEGFVSGWHTALASVGADIQEFAKRKTDFTDVKSEVDTTSTGSIAALRLMGDATRQTASIIQSGVHQIANAFAPLPGQLRYYASAAVNGFVSELLRGVAEAQAAATAIAAAVDQAIAKRLQIHSPSRVMANLGRHTVDPFLNELHRGAMEADRFFSGMSTPGMHTAGFAGGGGGMVNHYYVIEAGSYVGPAALSEIEKHIASGQAKRIDRGISSRGLGESF